MLPMGQLDADQLVALHDDMRYGPYLVHPVAHMLDLDHNILADLSGRVLAGQVDHKLLLNGQVASRSLSLTLADPGREIAIDGHDAADGAVFYDKMIAAGVRFKGPRLGRWVTMWLHTGPITTAGRTGYTAQITCQGKERLATGMVWDTPTYTAGTGKIAVIRDALEQTGEDPSRILLPALAGRIPKDIALEKTDNYWAAAVTPVAASMNRQPLYDGHGDFRIRTWPDDPKVVFTDGDGGTILTHPEVTYDEYAGWNGVWVKGPVKKTGKRFEATPRWLPRDHPCSPWSRARGGVPYRKAYIITNEKVRTQAEADEIADRYMRRLAREVVNVRADVMPNWLLEPGDVVAFRTLTLGNIEQVLREFSVPLMPGVPMSIGATKYLKLHVKKRKSGAQPAHPTATTRRHQNGRGRAA